MATFARVLLLALAGAVLVGCQTSRNTYSSVDNEGKRDFLRYAGSESPVFVDTRSAPFTEGDRPTAESVAVTLSRSAYLGRVAFTGDREAARQPQFRIVVAFDTPDSLDPAAICRAGPADTLPRSPVTGELRLHMAFCAREQTLSAALVRGPAADGPADPRFATAVRSAFLELFPRDRDRDRDRGQGVILF